ncbi:MAG: hypothetical protein C0606_00715 [Hyphomicrobiales bacterium]|nr:MAG: hypothetical protein C0606_00715 [Hyphomicrobiales bacterium]
MEKIALAAAVLGLALIAQSTPARAGDIPACAKTGAMSVMIGGRPAYRVSDLAGCPPELVEVSPNVMIGGEPVAHLRSGQAGKSTCLTAGSANVTVNGKQAQRMGDANCIEQ